MSKPKNAKSPWQPIGTAPNDGTHILVRCSVWGVMELWTVLSDPEGPEDAFAWFSPDGWYTASTDSFTHWMPIPPLPEGER